jgi:sec-independent protein translocase protein TatA
MSIWHWLILGLVVLLLFGGRNKISSLMGDFAQGIKAFKKGMKEEDAPAPEAQGQAQTPPAPQAQVSPPPAAEVKKDTAKV